MSVQTIQVFLSTQSPEILVGTLAHKNKKLYFEYDKDFLNTGIELSPAYDLTYSQGPGGEHSTTYLGEGKNPTEQHLIKLAKKHNINNAQTIISQIRDKIKK